MADHDSPRIRRLCISVDVERYSRWGLADQSAAQNGLDAVLDEACATAGLERATWSRQDAGDGELAVLPPGIDEQRTINAFVRELRGSLYRYNRRLNDDARLRVRVAMHVGMTQVAGLGFAGPAPVVAARLRDAAAVRRAMAEHPDADFVLVISQPLYEDHVGNDHPDLSADMFTRIRVDDPAKDFVADAWVHVPATTSAAPTPPTPAPAAAHRADRPPARDQRSGGVYVSGGHVTARDIAGRDLDRRPEDK